MIWLVMLSTSGRMWLETSTVRPGRAQFPHQVDGLLARDRIHAVEGFVQEDDVRIVGQGLGQLDLLAHALGVAAQPAAGGVGQFEAIQPVVDAPVDFGLVEAHQAQHQRQELAAGHPVGQGVALGAEAHPAVPAHVLAQLRGRRPARCRGWARSGRPAS